MKHATRPLIVLIALISLLVLGGCRESNQTSELDSLNINLVSPLFPPLIGEETLRFEVTDAEGNPVDDLIFDVKGDMTHAGMVPVLAEVQGGEAGRYSVPFEWTMGGDWVVTVNAIDETGQTTQRRFEILVDGDVPICNVDLEADGDPFELTETIGP